MPEIDFTNLSLSALVASLLFFATIDTAFSYAVAFVKGNFSSEYALDYLKTHVLKTGAPILGLAIVGHGIPALGIPPIPPAGVAAAASLAIYAITTIMSIKGTWSDNASVPTT